MAEVKHANGVVAAEVPLHWKSVQSFGDDNTTDDDLVTAVRFDSTGEYLAVGDKAGRICIFEGYRTKENNFEYKFFSEFQSHEPEFDCLKSLEIEEKINMIEWHKRNSRGLFLIASNDKTIKLWKVHQKKMYSEAPSIKDLSDFKFERRSYETVTTATAKRVFSNAHQYHINSISNNSDGETFISADDLRVNMWNAEISSESFNIVDVKPNNLEDLTEVITSATFHPTQCNVLIYSTSRGCIQLCDLRDNALCDHQAKQFKMEEDPANKSFFSEIIASISDSKFTYDGRYIVSRDFLTIKVWDVNMERRPVSIIPVHDHLKAHLCDLYENDCIFDKFSVDVSSDGSHYISGSYNNNFMIHNPILRSSLTIEASKDSMPPPSAAASTPSKKNAKAAPAPAAAPPALNSIDFTKKALYVAWHPRQNTVAVAGLNKLYIYQAVKPH